MSKHSLAIIIPSFRGRFLGQSLSSLASQTDKRFTVYIGDDASPDDLASIVDRYRNDLDIVYHRFDENVGGHDLCAQWARCIDLSDEEWVWLFSDDDVMDRECVGAFYAALEKSESSDLFRFNINVIDSEGRVCERCDFPQNLTPKHFARLRFDGAIRSYAVEYVFRRSAFDRIGGFIKFDLGWNSDDATWISLCAKGIKTIDGPRVSWRRSGANITSRQTTDYAVRKLNADLAYLEWVREKLGAVRGRIFWFTTSVFHSREVLTGKQVVKFLKKGSDLTGGLPSLVAACTYYTLKSIKRG